MFHFLKSYCEKHRTRLWSIGLAIVAISTAILGFTDTLGNFERLLSSLFVYYEPEHANPLDEFLAGLPWGNIAYRVPPSVGLDKKVDAWLRLSPQKTMAELQASLDAAHPVHFAHIQLAPRMKTTLASDSEGLQIIPNEDAVQAVSFSEDTVWSWRIIAHEPGSYLLLMRVAILLKIDGEDTYRTINSHQETLFVEATPRQRIIRILANYWQWIATTLAIPILAVLYRAVKARRTKRREAELEENRRKIGFDYEPLSSKNDEP
jgi:hypothetical protein